MTLNDREEVGSRFKPNFSIVRGCLTWREDHPSAICFLYSVYTQKVVLDPGTSIFLAERS